MRPFEAPGAAFVLDLDKDRLSAPDEPPAVIVELVQRIVLAGAHDQTVDIPFALDALDQAGLRYEKRIFERSAHNVLIDQERAEAARFVAEALGAAPG